METEASGYENSKIRHFLFKFIRFGGSPFIVWQLLSGDQRPQICFSYFLGGGKALRPTSTASEMTEVQWESSIERPQLIWEEGSFCFFAVVCVIERHHVNTTLLLSLTVFGSHRKQFNGSLLFFFVSRKISASFFFFQLTNRCIMS